MIANIPILKCGRLHTMQMHGFAECLTGIGHIFKESHLFRQMEAMRANSLKSCGCVLTFYNSTCPLGSENINNELNNKLSSYHTHISYSGKNNKLFSSLKKRRAQNFLALNIICEN